MKNTNTLQEWYSMKGVTKLKKVVGMISQAIPDGKGIVNEDSTAVDYPSRRRTWKQHPSNGPAEANRANRTGSMPVDAELADERGGQASGRADPERGSCRATGRDGKQRPLT